ncbi:hypothetical protein GF360_00740 [candidate division WWE3 bacterium]|nr:hypothetical protein [candidate division WWE3 bacterium]
MKQLDRIVIVGLLCLMGFSAFLLVAVSKQSRGSLLDVAAPDALGVTTSRTR